MFLTNLCKSRAQFNVTMNKAQWNYKLHTDAAHANPACTTAGDEKTCTYICEPDTFAAITFSDEWTQYDVTTKVIF